MMLEVKNIHFSYNGLEALKGVSLTVEEGSVVTIIGPNGAGKSTTMKAICGVKGLTEGEIWFQNRRVDGLATEEIVGLGITQVPEGRRIFPHMNVLENLEMGAYSLKSKTIVQTNLDKVFKIFPILQERRNQTGGSMSGGEQQMLAIARALMSNPKLILMDEPTLGLSPIMCQSLADIIVRLNKEQGMTILLVEQNARMALGLATWGYVLEGGKIALADTSENLKKNEKVTQVYLGQ